MRRFKLYLPMLLVSLSTIMLAYSWPKTNLDFWVVTFVVSFVYLVTNTVVGMLAIKGRNKAVSADEVWSKVDRRTAMLSYFFGTIWLASAIAWVLLDTAWGQRLRIFILEWSKFMFP